MSSLLADIDASQKGYERRDRRQAEPSYTEDPYGLFLTRGSSEKQVEAFNVRRRWALIGPFRRFVCRVYLRGWRPQFWREFRVMVGEY